MNCWTPRVWRSCVVRMKSLLEMLSSFQRSVNCGTWLSHHSWGVMPCSCADWATFWPCSSMPVKNQTSWLSMRCQRATVSAAMVVYAVPMWGTPFT